MDLTLNNFYNITPLTQAVKKNNIEIVRLLLNRDDILLENEYGGIPLQFAVGFGSIEVVKELLIHPKNSLIDIQYKDEIF